MPKPGNDDASAALNTLTINEEIFKQLITDRERFYAVRDALTVHERKKLDERVVLEKIYAGQNLEAVSWRETPDFSVRQRESREFGVEICKYYDSGSEARLREAPGYTQHLLSGGVVRHKDDVTGLSVTTVAIQDADGRIVAADEPAIMRQMPTLAAVVEGIRNKIREKDRLFPSHGGLAHVNLIVDERTGILGTSEGSEFYRLLGTPLLNDAVFTSRFREVFVISRFKSGPAYVPLKMLFTLARLFFFHDAVAETQPDQPIGVHHYMALFAAYLRSLTPEPVGIRLEAEAAEVLFGDTGFLVAEDSEGLHTTLRMYRDTEWPSCEAASVASSAIARQIQEKVRELMARSTFISPIAFPVSVP